MTFGFGSNKVEVRITGDSSQLKSELGKAERESEKSGNALSRTWKKHSDAIKVALAAGAAVGLKNLVSDSYNAANDLAESQNAVQKVFGESADIIDNFGNVASTAAGLSKREFNELSTVTGALLTNMGVGLDEAANKSITLTTRAADMASVFNTDVSTALEAINSGLKGEADPLEQFGVKLSAAAVKSQALKMGLIDEGEALDDTSKALATYQLIMEQTNKAAGDFIQTSFDGANAARIAGAEYENAMANLGESLLPIVATGLQRVSDGLLTVRSLFDPAAGSALDFRRAQERVVDALREGTSRGAALADGLLHIANNSDLTTAQFQALATAARITEDQYDTFRDAIIEQAEAMGVSRDIIDEMVDAINGATGAQEEYRDSADQAITGIEGLGESAEDTAEKFADLRTELEELYNTKAPEWRFGYSPAPGYRVPGAVPDNLPQFADGGTVPGAAGSPQLVVAHGGETITPRGGGGGSVVINVSGFVGSELQLAQEIDRMLTRRARTSGLDMLR